MPLPDERPRQSVANLIGRFEQQNKRHSLSASTSPPASTPIVIPGRAVGSQERKSELAGQVGLGLINVRARDVSPGTNSTILPDVAAEPRGDITPATTPPAPDSGLSLTQPSPSPPKTPEPAVAPKARSSAPPPTTISPPSTKPGLSRQPSNASAKKSSIPPKSSTPSRAPGPPPSSAPRSIRPQHTGSSSAAAPLRPQHTGASSTSTTHASIKPQVTGGGAAGRAPSRSAHPPSNSTPLRAKTPTAKVAVAPAASTPRATPTRAALTAPTASSLAKARQPPSGAAASPAAIKKPAAKSTATNKPPGASSVAFPSARKAKLTASASTPPSGARKPRVSQGGGAGPSAAALAARAAVAAGTAPPLPTSVSAPVALGVTTPSEAIIPTPEASRPSTPIPQTTTVMPTSSDGVVIVSDEAEGSVIVPAAEPLTEAALDRHDDKADDHLDDAVAMLEFGSSLPVGIRLDDPTDVSVMAVRGEDMEEHSIERGVDEVIEAGQISPENGSSPATPLPQEAADLKKTTVLIHDTIDDIPDEE